MENVNILADYLEQQKQVYKALLDVAKLKTNIVVEGKVQELEKITKVEETLVINMSKLEKKIESTIIDLSKELGISEDKVNISLIIKNLSGEDKKGLNSKRDELLEVLKQLDRTNELNSGLIKNSLDYINFSINLYSNTKAPASGGYNQAGSIQASSSISFFNKKS